MKVDHLSVSILLLIMTLFVYLSIFQINNDHKNEIFLAGLISFIVILPYLFRKETGSLFYSRRVISTGIIGIILTTLLSVNPLLWSGILLVLVYIIAKTFIRYRAICSGRSLYNIS